MLARFLTSSFGIVLVAAPVFAGGDDWRTVDPSELAMKTPVVEKDADSEALFWDIRINDAGEDLVLIHYIRIKVFTQRGCDQQSKIDIPYLKGTKIKDVAGRTIRPDGSISEVIKEDIAERTVVRASGVKLKVKSFAFPHIEPGAIIEYKWKEVISSASANYLRLQFQREIPIESITYYIKPSSKSFSVDVRPFNMPKPEFTKEKGGFYATSVKNMPAFREEPMSPPEDNVRSWAMINYYSIFSFTLGYWSLASRLYHGFQPYLKVDDEVERKAAEVIAGATTPEEKLERIFGFCRTNIKNTSYKDSGFTAEELEKMKANKKPSDTLKRGVGNWIDIDLLFAALANAAGFDARVALMPDRGKIFFDRTVLIPGALRPASVAVRIGESWKFFDPGFQYITLGMLRWQEEGVSALVTGEPPFWLKTPMSPPEKSKQKRTAKLRLSEDGTVEGDVRIEYTGHLAVDKKLLNEDDSPTQREESLRDSVKAQMNTAELSDIKIENVNDPAKPLVYTYHVKVPGYAERTGKRLFLQPAVFQHGAQPLFASAERKHDIYFHYPWSEEDEITIDLPAGFDLDNPDAPAPFASPPISAYDVKLNITKDRRALIYKRNFFFGGGEGILIPVSSYAPLKALFDKLNKQDNHTITLKQAAAAATSSK